MELKFFKTLWGYNGGYQQAVNEAIEAGMQGIEGPPPAHTIEKMKFQHSLADNQLDYIAEITTAGSYVPERKATLEQHLDSFRQQVDNALSFNPIFFTCLGGCDAWPEEQSLEFFHRAIDYANAHNKLVCFETHRSRSMFNPWITQRFVEKIPDINLTVDFSHWCVVCERLMDTELDVINTIAPNVQHIHARVGYDQGPQVPDPRAPEYEYALRAHQGWWETIWRAQLERNFMMTTMTPEFGPDGYLHLAPYTQEPVADLWDLNCWMKHEEQQHFERITSD